ncbi:MAG: undecaprenyl-diphosphate phosphatase [Pseudomonadota bacterium]
MSHPFRDALLLGAVQGITEFLPVSSDGHLALFSLLFRMQEGGLTFNVMLHAGTLVATALVVRKRLKRMAAEGLLAVAQPSRFATHPGARDALIVAVASLPTAAIGLGLRDLVDRWTHSPFVVGLGFLATSVCVASTFWVRPGTREHPSIAATLLVGIAQGLAVLPGFSRSGATITSALWLGVRPDRAFELSFLMSLPAVLGAIALELRHVIGQPFPAGPALAGALVAFVTGTAALLVLRRVVATGRFGLFALWTVPLAIATLAMSLAWPG